MPNLGLAFTGSLRQDDEVEKSGQKWSTVDEAAAL
jgi:hypothetical protein